jgi:hypothetical protein
VGVAAAADPSREVIVRFNGDATAAGRLEACDDARTDLEHTLPLQVGVVREAWDAHVTGGDLAGNRRTLDLGIRVSR